MVSALGDHAGRTSRSHPLSLVGWLAPGMLGILYDTVSLLECRSGGQAWTSYGQRIHAARLYLSKPPSRS
jgi:hypothetical protein